MARQRRIEELKAKREGLLQHARAQESFRENVKMTHSGEE